MEQNNLNTYKYCVLDVFTTERYKGNPLAVVFTKSDLELSVYENISREFGYSETSFIYYSKREKALKVRSFTPTGFEIHGAGHNLLGAVQAALLKNMIIFDEQKNGESFVIMKDETIHLSINSTVKNSQFIGMLQKSAAIGKSVDSRIIAAALSLRPDEMELNDLMPHVVKTEVTHLMVPVNDLKSLERCVAHKPALIKIANDNKFEGVYCFSILQNNPQYFARARFFNPGIGIDEDPATGSAAGPLAGFLYHNNYVTPDKMYQILQGVEMNQPSTINFEVKTEGIWISGSSVIVMEGEIYSG
ncbi:MAG TPA: PhzF family phenazine biosynthesis protein [Flavitalea sp.]|nr:PhzF family phenazine biosynthesis protein [Flavitalea sp.]